MAKPNPLPSPPGWPAFNKPVTPPPFTSLPMSPIPGAVPNLSPPVPTPGGAPPTLAAPAEPPLRTYTPPPALPIVTPDLLPAPPGFESFNAPVTPAPFTDGIPMSPIPGAVPNLSPPVPTPGGEPDEP